MTAAAEFPVTFGWYSYRLEARLLGWWGSSCAAGNGGRVRTPAPTADTGTAAFFVGAGILIGPLLRKETSRIFRRGRTLAGPPMTKDFRYAAGGASPSPTVLQRRTLLWVGKPLGAPARICARTVSSANPGAAVEPHRVQFWENQAPVGRNKTQTATQILRAGNALPDLRGNPRNGGPGVRRIWTRSVHPEPSPGDPLVSFPSLGKKLAH